MKTTPIPVKFDRQGHPCNFYAGFGPTYSESAVGRSNTGLECTYLAVWAPAVQCERGSAAACIFASVMGPHSPHLSLRCRLLPRHSASASLPFIRVWACAPQKSGSHIDAPHSRQPLVKGERLVRYEVNAVMPLAFKHFAGLPRRKRSDSNACHSAAAQAKTCAQRCKLAAHWLSWQKNKKTTTTTTTNTSHPRPCASTDNAAGDTPRDMLSPRKASKESS